MATFVAVSSGRPDLIHSATSSPGSLLGRTLGKAAKPGRGLEKVRVHRQMRSMAEKTAESAGGLLDVIGVFDKSYSS